MTSHSSKGLPSVRVEFSGPGGCKVYADDKEVAECSATETEYILYTIGDIIGFEVEVEYE